MLPVTEWQEECLSLPSVVSGKNLIYSLPTSGGKTLVAEMLIMKELICKEKDAMLVLPFVAIVQEKVSRCINEGDNVITCMVSMCRCWGVGLSL